MSTKLIIRLLFILFPVVAFGSSTSQYYYVSPTDVSIGYLNNLFGTVGDVLVGGTSSPLIGKIFYYFNEGVYLFTAALLTYIVLSSVIATSNEGKFITDKFNSWILIRSGLAISALVPLSSGYCMMQVLVMWSVTQGVGLANSLWSEAVYNISQAGGFGNTIFTDDQSTASQENTQYSPNYTSQVAVLTTSQGGYASTNYSSGTSSGSYAPLIQIYRSAFCAYTVYNYDKAAAKTNNAPSPASSDYGYFINDNQNLCFGSKSNSNGTTTYNCQCGEYTFPSSWNFEGQQGPIFDNKTSSLYLTTFNNMFNVTSLLYSYAVSTYKNISENNSTSNPVLDGSSVNMNNVCQVLSSSNTDIGTCLPASTLYSYSSNYNAFLASYQGSEVNTSDTSGCSAWVQNAQEEGWILAAAHYADLVALGGSSCSSNSSSITPWQGFMPYSVGANTNVINCSTSAAGSGSCYNYPCMTPNSGYGTEKSTLCDKILFDKLAQSNYNAFFNVDESNGMLQNVFPSQSGNTILGIPYIASTMQPATFDTNPMETSTFDSYFNDMLSYYINNFVINVYEPGSVGYDLMTQGGGRYIVNGTATLVTYVISEILGIDVYQGAAPDTIFSQTNMSSGTPAANPSCSSCLNNGIDYSGQTNPDCYSDNGGSCINSAGYGLFGMSSKYRNGEPFQDPLSSLAKVGRNILMYTLGYQTNLITNIFEGLKELVGDIIGGMIGAISGLALLGFLGVFGGSQIPVLLPIIQMCVEIIFQAHITILFTYMPFAIALTVVFITIGLILGIYLPFLPFLMFTSGVISWFISVVEAMAAAPLVAMGVTNPKGHELMGRAEQAMMLLLSVFVRPSTMIIGFIGAIGLSYASMYLLNLTFAYVFTKGLQSSLSGNSAYGTAILGGLLYTIVYAYSCYAILGQTFSLIFQVPDKVMRWLGNPRDSTGRDAMAMAGGVKSGLTDSGGSLAKDGGGGSMQQAQKGAPNLDALSKLDYSATMRQSEESEGGNSEAGIHKKESFLEKAVKTVGSVVSPAVNAVSSALKSQGLDTGSLEKTTQGAMKNAASKLSSKSSSTDADGNKTYKSSLTGKEEKVTNKGQDRDFNFDKTKSSSVMGSVSKMFKNTSSNASKQKSRATENYNKTLNSDTAAGKALRNAAVLSNKANAAGEKVKALNPLNSAADVNKHMIKSAAFEIRAQQVEQMGAALGAKSGTDREVNATLWLKTGALDISKGSEYIMNSSLQTSETGYDRPSGTMQFKLHINNQGAVMVKSVNGRDVGQEYAFKPEEFGCHPGDKNYEKLKDDFTILNKDLNNTVKNINKGIEEQIKNDLSQIKLEQPTATQKSTLQTTNTGTTALTEDVKMNDAQQVQQSPVSATQDSSDNTTTQNHDDIQLKAFQAYVYEKQADQKMELNDAISSVIKEVCDKKNDIQNAAASEQKTGRDESKK